MVGCSSNTNMYENKDSLNFSLVSEKLFYDVKYDFVEVIYACQVAGVYSAEVDINQQVIQPCLSRALIKSKLHVVYRVFEPSKNL